ncbi:MAG: OadG family protein [Desulfobacterales bacterium]|uniref:OadG family protein n=1 Tax=Candidatus Desulfatibia profunda TaxID=2841695 RepID=A0A8J6NQQ0_9BACT|nr:OadG family protein [Candidatus Desulfatibia profunda]MBL7180374.1 OadG family protein [Desulfobacterales bacterium]
MMTKTTKRFFTRILWTGLIPALLLIAAIPRSATGISFGEDLEKPRPEFVREGNKITAKLIPRAKSTSVLIHFKAAGGNLAEVEGMDFAEAKHPGVDNKDFKSELFVIKINQITPGAEVKVSITSAFFTSSTQFWVFNKQLKAPWTNAEAQNLSHPDLVQELVIAVKDGGPFDSDGVADGRITFVGGVKDSFWGYALGTLFIRFFGIFLVLGVLMIGMILSGKIFQLVDKKAFAAEKRIEPQFGAAQEDVGPAEIEEKVSPELATAVSLALHMHFSSLRCQEPVYFFTPEVTPWARQGRERLMNARFAILNRGNRLQNR